MQKSGRMVRTGGGKRRQKSLKRRIVQKTAKLVRTRFVASTTPALGGVRSLREMLDGEERNAKLHPKMLSKNATIRVVAEAVAYHHGILSTVPRANASTREKSPHLEIVVFLNPLLMPPKECVGLQGCHR